MNINEFSDDIRQVMEVLRNQPEGSQAVGKIVQLTVTGGSPLSGSIGPGTFNLAAEVAKETQRYLSADITKRLDLLQADLESLMAVDMDAVIERVVKARNAALVRLCR